MTQVTSTSAALHRGTPSEVEVTKTKPIPVLQFEVTAHITHTDQERKQSPFTISTCS